MKVYEAINKVQADLAKTGISKDRKNTQGSGYMFRGIDDVYNALSPLMAEHKLCILPRVLHREITERKSQQGNNLFYVVVEAEFDFVSAEDGSKHTVKTFGEAMDSGDKATNKAMSAAYKYAAFQAFAIPTEGDNDADAQTHTIKSVGEAKTEKPAAATNYKFLQLMEAEKERLGEETYRALLGDYAHANQIMTRKEMDTIYMRMKAAIVPVAKPEMPAADDIPFGLLDDKSFGEV